MRAPRFPAFRQITSAWLLVSHLQHCALGIPLFRDRNCVAADLSYLGGLGCPGESDHVAKRCYRAIRALNYSVHTALPAVGDDCVDSELHDGGFFGYPAQYLLRTRENLGPNEMPLHIIFEQFRQFVHLLGVKRDREVSENRSSRSVSARVGDVHDG